MQSWLTSSSRVVPPFRLIPLILDYKYHWYLILGIIHSVYLMLLIFPFGLFNYRLVGGSVGWSLCPVGIDSVIVSHVIPRNVLTPLGLSFWCSFNWNILSFVLSFGHSYRNVIFHKWKFMALLWRGHLKNYNFKGQEGSLVSTKGLGGVAIWIVFHSLGLKKGWFRP